MTSSRGAFYRALVASFFVLALALAARAAGASVLVNKAFAPTSVALGVTSTVTITLSNTLTTTAANVTSFSDDISTMSGKAQVASPNNLANTCGATTAAISGTVVSMSNGAIPAAADSTHPGTCTISFKVIGTAVGNGINSIAAGALVTDQGSNADAASQTLQVQSAVVGVAGSVQTNQYIPATATATFTITNPTAAALTSTGFAIALSSTGTAFNVTAESSTCGASFALSAFPAASGTVTASGATIAASSSCTVTLSLTPSGGNAFTVTGTLAASAISDAQGITNTAAVTSSSRWYTGLVTLAKSFSPSTIIAGASSNLTISLTNARTQALTNVAITDSLPANMTLDAAQSATPTTNGNCSASSTPVASGQGTGTIGLSAISIAAAGSIGATVVCTVTVRVDTTSSYTTSTNTLLASALSDDQSIAASGNATANLTVSGSALTASETLGAASVARGTPLLVTLNFNNVSGSALTAGSFTDNLPQTPVPMSYYSAYTPTFTNCGASSPTVTATGGNTIVSGSNLTIAAGVTCIVRFQVTLGSGTPGSVDANTIPAANISFSNGASTINPASAISASVTLNPAYVIKNFIASVGGLANQPLAMQGQIVLNSTVALTDTNAVATFVLNPTGLHKIELAAAPNYTFSGCGSLSASNITAGTGGESFTVSAPSISATCTIGYQVINETAISGASAVYTPGTDTYTSDQNVTTTNSTAQTYTATFYTTSLLVNKTFSPNSIAAGGTATATISLAVNGVSALATTQAQGVTFADTLPANTNFAAAPNVTYSGCGASPASAISGSTITFSGLTLTTVGVTQTACNVTFDVTSNFLGNTTNTIPVGGVTSTSGITTNNGATNSQSASASLTVVAGVALQKTFLNSSFAIGTTNFVRFVIVNSSGGTLGSGTLTDNMPSTLALASLTAQPSPQGGDPASCGGTVTGTIGASTFQLSNMSVAGATAGPPAVLGQCVQYVQVMPSTTASPGSVTNTIPAGALNIGGQANLTSASTPPGTITAAPNLTVSQAFSAASVQQHVPSTLTITIANTGTSAAPLSALAFTDTLPANLVVAPAPNASTTCTSGSVTAVAAATSFALGGGTLAAGASCTVQVNVVASSAGSYTNTIAAGGITTTQGATNILSSATLTVTAATPVTLSAAFSPASIVPNGISSLTLTIANTGSGPSALTSLGLSDSLPSGLVVAAVPSASTTCPSGTVTAAAGATSVVLGGGTLAMNASCTVTVNVTGTAIASYTDTLPIGSVTSYEGATNASPATAGLSIVAANPVTLALAFVPPTIGINGTSVLTLTIANTSSGSSALTSLSVLNPLPSGVVVAATPSSSTSCGSGTVAATGGGSSIGLSGGTLGAGASCTVVVSVTSATPNSYLDTIGASAISTTEGATNTAAASATLTVGAPNVTLTKSFAPGSIVTGGTSVLTLTIANTGTGAVALSGIGLTDTFPSGVVRAPLPNITLTCAGTVTSTSGTLTLGSGSLGAGSTCTFSMNVTSAAAGVYTDTSAIGSLTSTQGATNGAAASATLVVAPPVTVTPSFAPGSIVSGATTVLSIVIANTGSGAVPLTALALSQALPAGVVIAASPNANVTCTSGTASATAGGTTLGLSGGVLAAGASCTLSVDVTATTPGTFSVTVGVGAVATAQGVTNVVALSATLTVTPSPVTLTKTFTPSAILTSGTSQLQITIANTGAGAVALTGLALTDTLPAGVALAATPAAATTCGGTAGAAAGAVTLSGGTLAASASCTLSVTVTSAAAGTYTDTTAIGAVTTTQSVTNAATAAATLTVTAASPVVVTPSFVASTIVSGTTSVFSIAIANTGGSAVALTGLALSQPLPSGVTIAATPAAATTCPSGTASGAPGGTVLSLTGGTLAAASTCTVSVTVTATAPATYSATVSASAVTTTQGVTNAAPASASLIVTASPVVLTKTFAPSAIVTTAPSQLQITIANTGGGAIALTGLALTDTLPTGVTLAATPAATTSCTGGTAAAAAGALTLSGATLAASASCTVSVMVTSAATGSYTDTTAIGAVTTTQSITNAATAAATLTVTAAPPVTVTPLYTPASIVAGQTSVFSIAIANTAGSAVPLTALAFSQALPAGVTIAATPNATTTCSGGTVSGVAGTATVALTGATLAATSSCTVSVNVTSTVASAYSTTIAASMIVTAQGVTNGTSSSAPLTVTASALTLAKSFAPSSIPATSTSQLLITISNAGVGAIALGGMSFTDTLPTGVAFASAPAAAKTCVGGTVTAAAGALSLAGSTLAAGASCTVSAYVTSTTGGSYTDTSAIGAIATTQNITNAAGASATLTVTVPSSLTLTKTFSPSSIPATSTSQLQMTIANAGANAIALSGMAFTDSLPTGVALASPPAASTTCVSGTASAAAGAVALSGATLAAGASCTLSVTVTSAAAGSYTDTSATGAVTTTQGVSNAAPASASLAVIAASPVIVSAAFTLPSIVAGQTSVYVTSIANTGGSAVPLSALALSQNLPAGVAFAATPNASTTCGGGSVTTNAGTRTLALTGASLAPAATCTISVTVTSSASGTYATAIPISAVASAQSVTNAAAASATLTVVAPSSVTVTKTFTPNSIVATATSQLQITVANAGANAIALSGMSLTDTLPSGVALASVPAATTTCAAGAATASAGAVTLSGATLAAGASCGVTVTVTSTIGGTYADTTAAGAVATTQSVTNAAPASATLIVTVPSSVTLAKSFAPASIVSGATSLLTIAIANTGANAVALSGMSFTDTLPSGLALASAPNPATTCAGGTATASSGALQLGGASLAAGNSCTVSVTAIGQAPAAYVDTSAAGAVITAQSVSNAAPASASLTVVAGAPVSVTPLFTPASIALTQTSVLTISIANNASGAVALSGLALTDALPSGVTIAATPHASTTCVGGTVAAVAGATSVALSGGTLGANATCTIAVNVAAAANGTYVDAIPANAVTSVQHSTNTLAAQTTLTVASPTLVVTKTANVTGTAVSAGQPIAYTIAIANTGGSAETNATIVDTPANATLVPGSVRVNGAPVPDAVLGGTVPLGSIAAGTTMTVTYTATVIATVANGAVVTNRAIASGDQPCVGAACTANAPAFTVQPPNLTVSLLIDGQISETVVLGQVVTYAAVVANVGGSTATSVTFNDTLPVGITPIAGTVTVASSTRTAGVQHTLAASVNGQVVSADLGSLAPGASIPVTFQARITAPIPGSAVNTVTISALGVASAITSNVVIARSVLPTLVVVKTASASVAQAGDRIDFQVRISGPSGVAFGATTIVDTLPAGMLYAPGTARLNGTAVTPVVAGRQLTWTLPVLTASATLTYATAIGAGAPANGTLTNNVNVTATSPGGGPAASGSGSASVAIVASTFGSCYPITGRVYVDVRRSGQFEDGDRGVGGVRIYLNDGESVMTDDTGRYDFPCVHPGMHALRLDEHTLPAGVVPFADRSIDSERSTRRLVHRVYDDTIVEDINFAVDVAP